MACINRHIEQRIAELSKNRPAILLTCPRQSGKATMLKNLAEKLRQKNPRQKDISEVLCLLFNAGGIQARYVLDFIKGSGE